MHTPRNYAAEIAKIDAARRHVLYAIDSAIIDTRAALYSVRYVANMDPSPDHKEAVRDAKRALASLASARDAITLV